MGHRGAREVLGLCRAGTGVWGPCGQGSLGCWQTLRDGLRVQGRALRFWQPLPATSREDPGTSSGTWDGLGQDEVPEPGADRPRG